MRKDQIDVAILLARTMEHWWTYTLRINAHTEKTNPQFFTRADVAFKAATEELNRRGYYNVP